MPRAVVVEVKRVRREKRVVVVRCIVGLLVWREELGMV
jgi:hypothetical protein